MRKTRAQLAEQDASRLKERRAIHDRAKIQETADNLGIPLYIRPDGSVHQHSPGEMVRPVLRERAFDYELPPVPEVPTG